MLETWNWLRDNAGQAYDDRESMEKDGGSGWTSEETSGDMNAPEILYFTNRLVAIRFALEWAR